MQKDKATSAASGGGSNTTVNAGAISKDAAKDIKIGDYIHSLTATAATDTAAATATATATDKLFDVEDAGHYYNPAPRQRRPRVNRADRQFAAMQRLAMQNHAMYDSDGGGGGYDSYDEAPECCI
eukprot:16159-Heterococcus_DN1.PRE.1